MKRQVLQKRRRALGRVRDHGANQINSINRRRDAIDGSHLTFKYSCSQSLGTRAYQDRRAAPCVARQSKGQLKTRTLSQICVGKEVDASSGDISKLSGVEFRGTRAGSADLKW